MMMQYRDVILFLAMGLLLSCQSTETVEVKGEGGHVVLSYQVKKGTEIKHGIERSFYQQGQIETSSTYKEGKLHGAKIFFSPQGDTTIIEHYDQGVFHGEYLSFHEGGGLRQKGQYVNGKMQGDWLKYYSNGQLEERVPFVDNNENGAFIEYHANGKLKAKGSYKDGDNEHGPLEIYDKSGELSRTMECNMGVCKTIWRKEKDDVINEG